LIAFFVIPESIPSLRRAVLHPSLVSSTSDDQNSKVATTNSVVSMQDLVQRFANGKQLDEETPNIFVEKVLTDLASDDCAECPICLDAMQIAVILPGCLHQWYTNCVDSKRISCLTFTVARIVYWPSWLTVKKRENSLDVPPAVMDLSR
jgi:hypothetical protein